MDGKLLRGKKKSRGILAKSTCQDSCSRQNGMLRPQLGADGGGGVWSDSKGDQVSKVGILTKMTCQDSC